MKKLRRLRQEIVEAELEHCLSKTPQDYSNWPFGPDFPGKPKAP